MTESHVPDGAVVVGVDGSDAAAGAVAWAAQLARLEGRPLVLAHAIDGREAGPEVVRTAKAELTARVPDLEIHERVCPGDPRVALLAVAERGATLVVGSRGLGPVRSLLLGSVSASVVRHARCPVVVVRPHHPGRVRRGVLVGVEASVDSRPVLEAAFTVASERSWPLTVLHSQGAAPDGDGNVHAAALDRAPSDEARLAVSEALAGLRELHPDVHVSLDLADGMPWQALIRASRAMDLLVVGRHDRGPIDRLVQGSTAVSVVEHAPCPVLVVPVGSHDRLGA